MQGNRAALGKSHEHDILRFNAARVFVCNQVANNLLRFIQALCIFAVEIAEGIDVVPGAHAVAAVDRHWHHRRMGNDPADAQLGRQRQFRHQGHKVAAVSPQAVQPDDAVAVGAFFRLDDDGGVFGHGGSLY